MSSTPQTTTGTQTSSPIQGPQGRLFNNIWGDTKTSLGNALGTPIPQNWVAQATPLQWEGSQQMANVAPTLNQNAQNTFDLSKRIASGYYTNPMNDPNFQGAVKSVVDPATSNLIGSILPAIKDTALRAGGTGTGPAAYGGVTSGSSPQDVMTENVLQSWGRNLTDTIGQMAQNTYTSGLNLMGLVPGLNTSAITGSLAPSLATEQAGQLQQGFGQSALDNTIKSYMAQTQLPLSFEQAAAGVGAQGGFGNKYGSQTGPPPNLATQYLQGGLGGAGALNSLFGSGPGGSASVASNIGSGIAGAGSWLSGLFGGAGGAAAASPEALAMAGALLI